MCLFIHPVQYKHFRATYTIHKWINDKYWVLGNTRASWITKFVYKCKKYTGPFMFGGNADNFAFFFVMFFGRLINHSNNTQSRSHSIRPLLSKLAKKRFHQF